MVFKLKRILYFPIASYFRFFAAIRLRRWNPKIVVITGSNGKTTLLHLLESQIGEKAKYSHHANSSFGIPFDILDLHRKSLLKSEWISLILKTPLNAFKKPPKEKLYIVEADCDRPGEGKFLSELLKPEIVLWISTAKTHSMNFDHLVTSTRHPRANGDPEDVDSHLRGNDINKTFSTVGEAIAYEFGYFIESAKDIVIINGDSEPMKNQLNRTHAKVFSIKKGNTLKKYEVDKEGTIFQVASKNDTTKALGTRGTRDALDTFTFKYLLPEEVFYSIEMCRRVCEVLNITFDQSFSKFQMPPGRGSIFKGIKNTTIVDSTYNANLSSMKAILSMFEKITLKNKILVLSDMRELGDEENIEHRKLADVLNSLNLNKIILIGNLSAKYTFPNLKKPEFAISFKDTKDVYPYLEKYLSGGEVILFKGSQYFHLESLVEHLLKNTQDALMLPRRGEAWIKQRKSIGLINK